MLDATQSGPGNRVKTPHGDVDVVARISTDQGPYVIVESTDAEGFGGLLVNEGNFRDHEDVEFVSTTAAARAEEAEGRDEEAAANQAQRDRDADEAAARRAADTTTT